MIRRFIPLLAFLVLFTACDDDPEARDIRHYYNPVWSQDGSYIIAAYFVGHGTVNDPQTPVVTMAVQNTVTETETLIYIEDELDQKRYWVTAGNEAIAILGDELRFYDFEGNLLGTYVPSFINQRPDAVHFSTSDRSFLWALYREGTVFVGKSTYTDTPWQPTDETLLHSFAATSKPEDITETIQSSYVLVLEEGTIMEYPFVGENPLTTMYFDPYPSTNPWKKRIEYLFDSRTGDSYILSLNNRGLIRFNITTNEDSVIVDGQGKYVSGFDASDSTDIMILEVSDGDIWRISLDGIPLIRIGPSHRMARMSYSGKKAAAVGANSPFEDNLNVLTLIK